MIENTLNSYDYIACYLFWLIKNLDQRSKEEQLFLTNFFYKYQLLVITEPSYQRSDRAERINYILSQCTFKVKNVREPREELLQLFNQDLYTLTSQKQVPDLVLPLKSEMEATFGVKDTDVLQQVVRKNVHAHHEQLYQEQRQELLDTDRTPNSLTIEELDRRITERIVEASAIITKQVTLAISLELEKLREGTVIRDTKTALDGDSMFKSVQLGAEVNTKLDKLLESTMGGQDWSSVSLKDMPRWLKLQVVSGFKRLALTSVLLPIYHGPKAVINATLVKPLKLVGRRTNSMIEIIQEVWGWTIIGMLIAGVYVVVNYPTYEPQRQLLYSAYGSIEYIPSQILLPMKGTIQILWSAVPGQQFFADVFALLSDFMKQVPGYILGWVKDLIIQLGSHVQSFITTAVSEWWKTVKLTPW